MSIYCKYIAPLTTQPFHVGKYKSLPAIVSNDCTKFGIFNGLDGGMVCAAYKELLTMKGSKDPATSMKRWDVVLNCCKERQLKDILTDSDFSDAKKFAKNTKQQLTPAGMDLKNEAQGQVGYGRYMASFCKRLPPQSFKTMGENSAPGLNKFLGDVAECWKSNPDFRSGLQVALVKTAIAKSKSGNKSKIEEKVLNFYRFMNTYNKKATEVLLANVGGPSERYLKSLNAHERDSCILDSGKDTTDLAKRIDAAIERRSNNGGGTVTFGISIAANKVAKSLEVSSGFQAITGSEYLKHFIGIKGMSKDQVTKILDGKDDIMCKISQASEIKVALLTFQISPPGVPISELVAAWPQFNH